MDGSTFATPVVASEAPTSAPKRRPRRSRRVIEMIARPVDHRCRFWAVLVRRSELAKLPLPADVDGARAISATTVRGVVLMRSGDVLMTGEENHHRKLRGWTYRVRWVNRDGSTDSDRPDAATKRILRANGLPPEFMAGAGGPAACVRLAHGLRLGFWGDVA